MRSQHEHWHVAQLADALEGLPPVHLRHRHVQEDQIRAQRMERAEGREPVGFLVDLETGPSQQLVQEQTDVLVVVHDEHGTTD